MRLAVGVTQLRHDNVHVLNGVLLPRQDSHGPFSLHFQLFTEGGHIRGTFLMELDAACATTEAADQQSSATFAEGETEEGLPNKVVADPGGDGQALRHLHLDVLPAQPGHVCVPVDGGLAGVLAPVHGARLRCQLPQLHGLAQGVPQCDPRLHWHTRPPMVAQVSSQIGLGNGFRTACAHS